ncbi:MAG: GIY-YIG nuclease family protein [Rhodothermales bacterium]|nr:GIY-YIG nuclease family protein [Rhodothermales bacterium]
MQQYFFYIMASRTRTLYAGVTNDLARRVQEHKHRLTPGFTSRYRVNRLVYYESYRDIREAIRREKQVKAWRREKKTRLIESMNPGWLDLSEASRTEETGSRARRDHAEHS